MSGSTKITISEEGRMLIQTELELNLTIAESELSRYKSEEAKAMSRAKESAEQARLARIAISKFEGTIERLKLRIKGISVGFTSGEQIGKA